jgi:hypothetical protein
MLVLDQICNVYFFKDLYLLRFCRKIKTTNTCIHQHKHRSSNTILGKKPNKSWHWCTTANPSGALEFTPFRSTWLHTLPEHLSSNPSGALEFTPFRSAWVHTLQEHLSSHPSGALQFTPFRSTSVHTIPEHFSSHLVFSSLPVRVPRSVFLCSVL